MKILMNLAYHLRTCCFPLALLCAALWGTCSPASPEIPGAAQSQPIALVGGTIHPVSDSPIEGGTLLFAEGVIQAVGGDVDLPADTQRIDVSGLHVYPSLIDAMTDLGLVEINAVRSTRDQRETGAINPNVKAQVAFNPDSELIPVARSNGILLALSAPSGSLLAGQSALMRLDGWTWEDMTQKAPVAMHVHWPRMTPLSAWWSSSSEEKPQEKYDQALEQLRETLRDARAYQRSKKVVQENGDQIPYDARWEAMLPLLRGELPWIVHADQREQIQSAVAFAAKEEIRIMLYGGYDAADCADLLKRHEVPVIVGGVHRLPARRHSPYDEPFTLPERLRQADVQFCIASGGRWSSSMVRNLPYHAGTAVAYGLPRQEALRSITLYPARILGVEDRVGSLEVGKDATLIVTTGNPLETPSLVTMAFIQGRQVELDDRHKRLNRKYSEKVRRFQKTDSE